MYRTLWRRRPHSRPPGLVALGIVLLLSAPAAGVAAAAEDRDVELRLWLHGLSDHAGNKRYNEVNPGLGVEFQLTDRWSGELGQYRNSFGRPTRYALGHYEILDRRRWRSTLAVGTADNYQGKKFNDGEGVPMAGATIAYRRARLILIPDKDLERIAVRALSLRVDWRW